jgi:3-oxoadipate enol-lactonase
MSSLLGPLPTIDDVGQGSPVVLLHCLGVDSGMWTPIVSALQTNFRVISYDLPGHGRSAVPQGSYGITELADQLAEIFRARQLTRAHVVGMSLGGLVAQEFAARYPGLLDRLVLIDTTPQYTPMLKQKWVERAAIARSRGVGPMIDEVLLIWFTPDFVTANGPVVRWVRDTLTKCSGEGYALACQALESADLRELVKRIQAPTLILLGEGDLPPFHEAAAWMSAQIAGSKVELIPEARHAAPLQQPAMVADRLTMFFRDST